MRLSTFGAILLVTLTLSIHTTSASDSSAGLSSAYDSIRAEATRVAGAPLDMPQRAMFLYEIYQDSGGNYAFPLVALHGALWGYKFFEVTGPIGDEIALRYFYSSTEMQEKKQLLHAFSLSFQETNRSVFIDTYTNYYFTKKFGTEAGAERFVNPVLLKALNLVHRARKERRQLDEDDRRSIFETALYYEQELTVGPRVRAAVQAFHCPVLTFLALKPIVHFAYFPKGTEFFFKDFSDQQERILRATDAYDIANSVGWESVKSSIKDYGVIPETFFADPSSFVTTLKAEILSEKTAP